MKNKLAIVIPTRNRPNLLRRSLVFYARHGFPHKIAVADSSDSAFHANMDGLLEEFSDLSLEITRFPADYNSWLKIIEVMEAQHSDYVGLSGDDDILLNSGVSQCVDFLDSNRSVSVVDGRELRVALPSPLLATYWGFSAVLHEQNPAVATDPMSRLVQYFQSYWPTFYGIHRRASVIESFRTAHEMNTENLVSELMQGAITVLNGGYHFIEAPYIIRQVYHNQSTAFDSWSQLVESEEFQKQVEYFRERVQAKFPNDERVRGACDLAFDRFLKSMLPDHEFLSSSAAITDGKAAHALKRELILDNEKAEEKARILNPENLRQYAEEINAPILLEAARLVTKNPNGIAPQFTKSGASKLQSDCLSDNQQKLIARLCFDGFSDVVTSLMNFVSERHRLVTYQTVDLYLGKNQYTLPSISACVFVANMALMRGNIDLSKDHITVVESSTVDMGDLVLVSDDQGSDGDQLDKMCWLFLKYGSSEIHTLSDALRSLFEKDAQSETAQRPVLMATFSTVATAAGQLGSLGQPFVQRLADLHLPIVHKAPLLAELARLAFAELQTELLVESDSQELLTRGNLADPEAIFWASKYAAALYAAGRRDQALETKNLVEAVFESRGDGSDFENAAMARAEEQWRPHKEWIESCEIANVSSW